MKKFEEIVLAAVFAILCTASSFFSIYMGQSYQSQVVSNGFYSDNAIFFKTDERIQVKNTTLREHLDDGILFAEKSIHQDIRRVFYCGEIYTPPIKNGRFFTHDDLFKDNLAVIGSFYSPDVFQRDNVNYIHILGEDYQVIGKTGYNQASRLDRLCMVSSSGDFSFSPDEVYCIDGNSRTTIEKNFSNLQSIAGTAAFERILRSSSGVQRFFKQEINNLVLFAVLILYFVVMSIFVSVYWFEKRIKAFAVMRLFGYSSRQLFKAIFARFSLYFFIGYASGALCTGLLVLLFKVQLQHVWMSALLVSYCIVFMTTVLSACFLFFKAKNMSVAKQLH